MPGRINIFMLKPLRSYLNYIYSDTVRKRLLAQINHIQLHKPVELYLDLGCHIGYNTDRVREVIHPARTLGLDFSFDSVKVAHGRGIYAARHDLNQPLPLKSNSVDLITAFDVLEHLVETWQVATEIYRVLKPGGILLIDCPNLASWHNVFLLALGYQPSSGPHLTSIIDSDLHFIQDMHRQEHLSSLPKDGMLTMSKMHRHIVVPTYRSMRRLLIQLGFEINGTWGIGYYPFPPALADLLSKIDIAHCHHYLINAQKPLSICGQGD